MIHPSAIIDPKAQLASDVEVGPFTVIGPDVTIDSGTRVESHVVIKGPTSIGKDNHIYQFSSVGEDCQDKKYNNEPTRLEVGDRNEIREYVTLHRGTTQDQSLTKVGSDNLFMAYVHVGHDCVVGDGVIMANNATLAGHVHVGDGAILGGFTGVHQFCTVGAYSMAGFFSAVNKDVPAFVLVSGIMAKAFGMNFEGMKRRGYSSELRHALRNAYKLVYRSELTLAEAILELEPKASESAEMKLFVDSLTSATRGIVR